jgi:hypothetical protein
MGVKPVVSPSCTTSFGKIVRGRPVGSGRGVADAVVGTREKDDVLVAASGSVAETGREVVLGSSEKRSEDCVRNEYCDGMMGTEIVVLGSILELPLLDILPLELRLPEEAVLESDAVGKEISTLEDKLPETLVVVPLLETDCAVVLESNVVLTSTLVG